MDAVMPVRALLLLLLCMFATAAKADYCVTTSSTCSEPGGVRTAGSATSADVNGSLVFAYTIYGGWPAYYNQATAVLVVDASQATEVKGSITVRNIFVGVSTWPIDVGVSFGTNGSGMSVVQGAIPACSPLSTTGSGCHAVTSATFSENFDVSFTSPQASGTTVSITITFSGEQPYYTATWPVTISSLARTISIYEPCWQYTDNETCYSSTYSGNCDAIAATNGCSQTSSSCSATDPDGVCHTYDDVYTCGAQLGTVPTGVTTLPASYTVTQTNYDQCGSYENNTSCKSSGTTCVDGPSTKIINGDPVYESCWQYETTYTCIGSSTVNDCQTLQSQPQCIYQGQQCVSTNSAGTCMQWQDTYNCSTSGVAPSQVDCGGRVYCINGECDTSGYTPNKDFAKAATWLNLVQGMGSNIDPATLRIFSGTPEACGIAFLGFSNCCSDNGWGVDLSLAQCSAEEKQLAQDISNKLTHYVGTYCAQKDPVFGTCLVEKKSYCKFESLLARVLQEQGRPQLGKSWGDPSSPDCSGFTVAELQSLDFSKIDLSEFYPQLYQQVSVPGQSSVTSKMTQEVQSYYAQTP